MGWKCVNCGYLTEESLETCPKCGSEIWHEIATQIKAVEINWGKN